jgi:hypothetical protein
MECVGKAQRRRRFGFAAQELLLNSRPKTAMSASADAQPRTTHWTHAPLHKLSESGTYLKANHFRTNERLAVLQCGLLAVAEQFGWQLEAWAVFSNHYHCTGL